MTFIIVERILIGKNILRTRKMNPFQPLSNRDLCRHFGDSAVTPKSFLKDFHNQKLSTEYEGSSASLAINFPSERR